MLTKWIKAIQSPYVWPVIAIWLVYCAISLLEPQNEVYTLRYGVPMPVVNLLLIIITIPQLLIWLFAVSAWRNLLGVTRIGRYAEKRNSYRKMTAGLAILAAYMIASPLASAVYGVLDGDRTNTSWALATGYAGTFSILAGFSLLYAGSAQLMRYKKRRIPIYTKIVSAIMPAILFMTCYMFLVLIMQDTPVVANVTLPATYLLPFPITIVTIIVPLMVTWLLGLLSTLNLEHYSHFTETRYKKGMAYLYNGILVIVMSTILSQALVVLGLERILSFNLGYVLLALYGLLGMVAFGFSMISRGARDMEKQLLIARGKKPLTITSVRQPSVRLHGFRI